MDPLSVLKVCTSTICRFLVVTKFRYEALLSRTQAACGAEDDEDDEDEDDEVDDVEEDEDEEELLLELETELELELLDDEEDAAPHTAPVT
jgi:hypothetical protein